MDFETPAPASGQPPGGGLAPPRRWFAMAALVLTIVMVVMDGVAVTMILPRLTAEFAVDPAMATWVVNVYQLVLIALLLPMSALSQIVGYRRVYLSGIAIFALFGAMSALSDGFAMLLVSRSLQGVGAACVMAINLAMWRLIVPPAMLGRMIGVSALAVALAATAGPSVAGLVLAAADWHAVLALPIPVLVVAGVIAVLTFPESIRVSRPFDFASAGLNIVTFTSLVLAVSGLGQGWPLPAILALFGLGVGAVIVLCLRLRTDPSPLLPLDLLAIPGFALSTLASVCAFCTQMTLYVTLPFMLQNVLSYPALEAGLMFSTWPLMLGGVAVVSGALADRVDAAILGMLGLLGLAAGLAVLAGIGPDTPMAVIVFGLGVCGAGFGLFQSPNNRTMMALAPPARASAASGALATARLLGQAMGTAFAGVALGAGLAGGWRIVVFCGIALALAGALASIARRAFSP